MRVRTVQLMRRVLTGAAAAALGIGVLAQSGAEPESGGFQGVADLRSRSWRHALFAADADHAGQRRPAAGRRGCIT